MLFFVEQGPEGALIRRYDPRDGTSSSVTAVLRNRVLCEKREFVKTAGTLQRWLHSCSASSQAASRPASASGASAFSRQDSGSLDDPEDAYL